MKFMASGFGGSCRASLPLELWLFTEDCKTLARAVNCYKEQQEGPRHAHSAGERDPCIIYVFKIFCLVLSNEIMKTILHYVRSHTKAHISLSSPNGEGTEYTT